MDIINFVEIKEEPLDNAEVESNDDQFRVEKFSELREVQKHNCFANVQVKNEIEIEIKDEPFPAMEEDIKEGQFYENFSGSIESQKRYLDEDHEEKKGVTLGGKDSCRSGHEEVKGRSKTNEEHNGQKLAHQNTKLFKCSECGFETNYKNSLERHMLIHENSKLFKCSECSFESNHKESLKRHMLIHENLKSKSKSKLFKCAQCSYEFNRKQQLQVHMFTHTNTKLFKCSECSYECIQKCSLQFHMLTHTKTKLFKCTLCSYECNQKRSLGNHILSHTNIKLFKCSECSFQSNWKHTIKRHMLKHTNRMRKKEKTTAVEI